jgi:adenylate cyclase
VNLLNTYVGRGTGEHILTGQIRRGEGDTIHVAIWYCDLRSFTRMTDWRSSRSPEAARFR